MLGILLTLAGLTGAGINAIGDKAYDIKRACESTNGEYLDHKGILRNARTDKQIYRCCGDDGHYYKREGDWYDHKGDKIGTIDETLGDRIVQLFVWRNKYWNEPTGSKGVLMYDAKYIYYQMKKYGIERDSNTIWNIVGSTHNEYLTPNLYACYKNHREGEIKLCYKIELQQNALKVLDKIVKEKYKVDKVHINQEFYIDIFDMNIYAAEGKYANEFRGKSESKSNYISYWMGDERKEVTIWEMEDIINEFNSQVSMGAVPEWKRTGIEKLFVEGTIDLKRLCGRTLNERSGKYE